MAEKLELVKGYDFQADAGTVSFLDYQNGLAVAYDGWAPKTEPQKDGFVYETLTLRARGTSTDDLATVTRQIEQLWRDAGNYAESPVEPRGVWLCAQLDGETNARQSFVIGIETAPGPVYNVAARNAHHINEYTVGVKRMPWWESVTAGTASAGTITAGSVGAYGGTIAYSGVNGDLPARIMDISIGHGGGSVIFPRACAWVGFRGTRFGDPAKFVPYWWFGTASGPWGPTHGIAGGGSVIVDTASVTGSVIEFVPQPLGDSSNQFVWAHGLYEYTTQDAWDDQRGEFLALLRMRVTSGAYLVQMRSGWLRDYYYAGGTVLANVKYQNALAYPRIYVPATTDYRLYEAGVVYHPHRHKPGHLYSEEEIAIIIYAERISGSGALRIDGVVLIPLEGFVKLDNYPIGGIGETVTPMSDGKLYGVQAPNLDTYGLLYSQIVYQPPGYPESGTLTIAWTPRAAATATISGGIPPGNGIMVTAANSYHAGANWKTNAVSVVARYAERWRNLRGNS